MILIPKVINPRVMDDESICKKCGTENKCPCKHCHVNFPELRNDTKWRWIEDGCVAVCGNCEEILFS